jgi:hypothetical protein
MLKMKNFRLGTTNGDKRLGTIIIILMVFDELLNLKLNCTNLKHYQSIIFSILNLIRNKNRNDVPFEKLKSEILKYRFSLLYEND